VDYAWTTSDSSVAAIDTPLATSMVIHSRDTISPSFDKLHPPSKSKESIGMRISEWHPTSRHWLNNAVIVGSVLICLLLLPTRFPGMELAGIGPHWLLIWVVTWSIGRSPWHGLSAGVILGLLQDGLTAPDPTHALSLGVIGFLTARLQKQHYTEENFISIALIVFAMSVLAETITAVQFSLMQSQLVMEKAYQLLSETWIFHQQVALASAIVTSLWAPVVHYPLNRWWRWMNELEQPS
jgi:rod shape-determining protein MreD